MGCGSARGVGFTISVFIAQFAYDDVATASIAKVGIFAGSVLSGTVGAVVLLLVARRPALESGGFSRSDRIACSRESRPLQAPSVPGP